MFLYIRENIEDEASCSKLLSRLDPLKQNMNPKNQYLATQLRIFYFLYSKYHQYSSLADTLFFRSDGFCNFSNARFFRCFIYIVNVVLDISYTPATLVIPCLLAEMIASQ